MKKIKVKFLRYKTVLMAEVIDFPTELRGNGLLTGDKDDYRVFSEGYLNFGYSGKTLFLVGRDKEYDQKMAAHQYGTEEEAIDAMNAFVRLIQDYNATLAEDTTDCTTALLDVKITQ